MAIARLEEELESGRNDCQEHIKVIQHLSVKLKMAEERIVELEEELDFAYQSSSVIQPATTNVDHNHKPSKEKINIHKPLSPHQQYQQVENY